MRFLNLIAVFSLFFSPFNTSVYANPTSEQYEVVVIGGGISGLSTVEMLARKGITNVLVLEQNERVGGKMWTERGLQPENGPYYERGAELVNTSDTELIELIKSLGLGITERRFKNESRGEVFYFRDRHLNANGQIAEGAFKSFTYEELVEKMHEFQQDRSVLEKLFIMQELRAKAQGSEKAQLVSKLKNSTAMSQVNDGVYTKSFLEALMKSEFGVSLTQVNAEVLLDYVRITKSLDSKGQVSFGLEIIPEADEKFRVTGGTDSIIKKLELKHSNKINKNSKVESVVQRSSADFEIKINSTSAGQRTVKAKHVVFAVPAYDLVKMNVSIPEISARKLQEVANLPYGENAKIFLVFNTKFWDSAASNPHAFSGVGVLESGVQFWDTTENQKAKEGVITLYPGEWPTDKKQQQARLQEIISQLKQVPGLEQIEQHLKTVDMQIWQKSYAGTFNPSYPRSPSLFAQKLNSNVYFVGADKDNNAKGEITASYGYMNGAVRTAIRASNRILDNSLSQSRDVVLSFPKAPVRTKMSCRMLLNAG